MEAIIEVIRPVAEALGLPAAMLPSALAVILILRFMSSGIEGFGYRWVYAVGTAVSGLLAYSFRAESPHPIAAGLAMLAIVLFGQFVVNEAAARIPGFAWLANNGMVAKPPAGGTNQGGTP